MCKALVLDIMTSEILLELHILANLSQRIRVLVGLLESWSLQIESVLLTYIILN